MVEGEAICCDIPTDSYNLGGKTFTLENVQEFQRLFNSSQDCLRCMSEVLDLKDYMTRARQAFILDYFYGINMFAREVNFSMEQAFIVFELGKDILYTLLGFFSIMHYTSTALLKNAIQRAAEKWCKLKLH